MRNLPSPPLTMPLGLLQSFQCLFLLKEIVSFSTQAEKVVAEKQSGAFGLWTVMTELRLLAVQEFCREIYIHQIGCLLHT